MWEQLLWLKASGFTLNPIALSTIKLYGDLAILGAVEAKGKDLLVEKQNSLDN